MITKGKWECGKSVGIWCDDVKILSIQYPLSKEKPFEICDEEARANALLIVSACNACQEINPDNPQAAAEALVLLRKVCKALADIFPESSMSEMDAADFKDRANSIWVAALEAKQALSKAEGKE